MAELQVRQVAQSAGEDLRRKARLGAPWDGWAGFKLTGNRNSTATGWGLWTATKKVDLFQKAALDPNAGDIPYNNWIIQGQHPKYDVFPTHIGLYLGGGLASGDPADNQFVQQLVRENCMVELQTSAAKQVLKQAGMSLPPGTGILQQTTDAFQFLEQHGPTYNVGMFEIPQSAYSDGKTDFKITKDETVNCYLHLDPDAQTALAAMVGSFPAWGTFIGVRMLGWALYQVPTGPGL